MVLTDDGIVKLANFGLEPSILLPKKRKQWYEAYEVFCRNLEKSDVLPLGTMLIEIMDIIPSMSRIYDRIDNILRDHWYERFETETEELIDFLKKCVANEYKRWSVNELMNVNDWDRE